jgi:4-alpha-glucanotransferase
VRSATEEQFAVVAIESERSACAVIGEDLGTVPDEVRDAMDRHRVLRSYVAEFAMPAGPGLPLGQPDQRMVATADTHDTPTFAAFIAGDDLRARQAAGLLDAEHADIEIRARQHACAGLAAALDLGGYLVRRTEQGALLRGLLEFLGDSDAPAMLVSLDDLRGETQPQNVPGTSSDRPNWVIRMPDPLNDLAADPWVTAVLKAVQRRRLASHGRARAQLENEGSRS